MDREEAPGTKTHARAISCSCRLTALRQGVAAFRFPLYDTAETVVKNITAKEREKETRETRVFKAATPVKASKGAGDF